MAASGLSSLLRRLPIPGRRRRTLVEGRRAALAALFRRGPSGAEHLLFIKRAASPSDPWSGHVALPGGRAELADKGDDEATAARETLEEVGIDPLDGSWRRLGRIVDDRLIYPGGRPLTVALFGFEQIEPVEGAPAELAQVSREVEFAWWVPTSVLSPESLFWRETPLEELVPDRGNLARAVLRASGADALRFAAIPLPPPTRVAEPPVLWGLTLAFISDVLLRARGTALVGPRAPAEWSSAFRSSGGTLADTVLAAALEGQRLRAVARACIAEHGRRLAVLVAAGAGLVLVIIAPFR